MTTPIHNDHPDHPQRFEPDFALERVIAKAQEVSSYWLWKPGQFSDEAYWVIAKLNGALHDLKAAELNKEKGCS